MKKYLFLLGLVIIVFLATGCLNFQDQHTSFKKINVLVTINPQAYFVQRIGGDKVQVTVLVPQEFNPATYSLSVKQIEAIKKADIYFQSGHLPFEKTESSKIKKINPSLNIVDTSQGISWRCFAKKNQEIECPPKDYDPHVWLNPLFVKIQAENIYKTLVKINPKEKKIFLSHKEKFSKELDILDKKIAKLCAPYQGKFVLVYHPVLGYFTDHYGLKQVALQKEGKEPSLQYMEDIFSLVKSKKIKALFLQKQFQSPAIKSVAEKLGVKIVVFDPLRKDYFLLMEELTDIILKNL